MSEWEVLCNICKAHGIEISEPQKSRGYSFTTQEYGEHQDKINALEAEKAEALAERDDARAELEKASKQRAKLTEIDSLETGKTMFGGKVTVSQEDWDNVTTLAKREVSSYRQTKKLRQERDEAVQERDDLKAKCSAMSEELSAYKKKEADSHYFSRKKMQVEAQRISKE